MLARVPRLLLLSCLILWSLPAAAQVPTLTLGSAATLNLIPPGPIQADGKRIHLAVVVTDPTGALANGVRFRGSSATAGRLDIDCPQKGPGLYDCTYTTPDKAVTGASLNFKARLASGDRLESSFPIELKHASRARFGFSASPKEIVLTQDPSSSLVFTVTDPSGRPLEGLDLRAASNVGQVQAISSAGGGTYSAVYVPPAQVFPQVALLSVWAADAPDQVFGFFRIPLVGKVNYPVDARAPGVTLVFRIGETTFPPVVSDASGRASVPITVPPGINEATVELIQATGARSTQAIDLQVPPFSRMALGGAPAFVPADGRHKTPIRVFVVDSRGRPADGQNINFTTTSGEVSPVRFVGNGLYEAVFTAPALSASGSATITASLAGEEGASSSVLEIGLEPPAPSGIALSADPVQMTPNVSQSTLTATVLGNEGQPSTGGHEIEIRTADGPVQRIQSTSSGVFTAQLPVNWNVRTRAQAVVRTRGNQRPVEGIVALPMNDWVLTNQKMPITVVTVDTYGNPVSSVAVNCSATGGGGSVTSSVQTDVHGLGTVLYTAGPLAGFASVTCSTETASYSAPLWQASQPLEGFEFPVSGGQDQGRLLARWRKLRATVDLLPATQAAPPEPATATVGAAGEGGLWGQSNPEPATTAAVSQDSGSVGAPGSVSQIQLSAIPSSVPSTGGTANLVIRVTDSVGTLVPGENILLIADAGSISNKTDNGDGTFSALLTVPPDVDKKNIQVTATRPSGDIASFTRIGVGGKADKQAAAGAGKKPKKPKKAAATTAPSGSDARMGQRTAQLWFGWTPGTYSYSSNPCIGDSDPCEAPADGELDGYDFLKADLEAPIPGSFALGGEWFPFQDYVGVRASYARLSYTTEFEANSGGGDAHCDTHFCDSMSFVNVDVQGRFALLKQKGPLDLLVRVGYQFQDVVIFRKLYDPTTQEREARFETIGLHGLRAGAGIRYTVLPLVRPHLDYNISFGLQATLGDSSFGVPGVTNHNVVAGVSLFPWKGLLVDVSYDYTSRSLGLAFDNEAAEHQRGELAEQAHSLRLSAGWAF